MLERRLTVRKIVKLYVDLVPVADCAAGRITGGKMRPLEHEGAQSELRLVDPKQDRGPGAVPGSENHRQVVPGQKRGNRAGIGCQGLSGTGSPRSRTVRIIVHLSMNA